jgi:hypothetical protein
MGHLTYGVMVHNTARFYFYLAGSRTDSGPSQERTGPQGISCGAGIFVAKVLLSGTGIKRR